MSSGGFSAEYSRASPVDWCALLRGRGPLGLLGAPAAARMCGIHSWPEGPSVTLEWEGAQLPVAGGGPPALLGGPPARRVEPPPRQPLRGSGGYAANPMLHRRLSPGASCSPFPGCLRHPWDGRLQVGLPDLEPLEAREPPGGCREAAWRPASPPEIGGHALAGVGECVEAPAAGGRARLRVCSVEGGFLVESGGHAAVYSRRLRLERRCADYMVGLLHPGGPAWFYVRGEWEASAPALAVECPAARLYAAARGWVRLRVEGGSMLLEAAGEPIIAGPGGPLRAAAAAVESLVDPAHRWPRRGLGHARCGGCVGLAWPGEGGLAFTLWSPGGPGVFEARLRVVAEPRARVFDALGESWVPVEAGLVRVPLPRGWHSLVVVGVEEWGRPSGVRLASLLRRRLGEAARGS
ncbi:MAG: hypothetical protein LRS49_03130 [Desulfurococcales archaeon]|nr:hypothetical protein [Desulfurococcales archaeon]